MSDKKKIELLNKGNFPSLKFNLDTGDTLLIEKGSMVQMTPGIKLSGVVNGGILTGLIKKTTTGENFFITKVSTTKDNQELLISPHGFGDISKIVIEEGDEWGINSGVFLACTMDVEYNPAFQGVGKALFADNGGWIVNKVSGQGYLFVESFGAMLKKELKEGESIIVDNHHLIAWEWGASSRIKVVSGLFGYTSGEGLGVQLNGPCRYIVQSRNALEFSKAMQAKIKEKDINTDDK